MAIINQKDIYDSSKGNPLEPLIKSLDILNDEIVKLTGNSKKLEKELRDVQKTSDGKEAKNLVKTTKNLNTQTVKLTKTKTTAVKVNEQILKANAKLVESRSREAKDLAKLKVLQTEQNKKLREGARESLGMAKSTNGLRSAFKGFGVQMLTSLGLMGGMVGAFTGLKNLIGATAEGQIFLAKVTGATNAVLATFRDYIIDGWNALTDFNSEVETTTPLMDRLSDAFFNFYSVRGEGFLKFLDAGSAILKGDFKEGLTAINDGFVQVTLGIEGATEKSIELANQIERMAAFGAAIAVSEKKLALDRSRFGIKEAKDLRSIAELRAKAADKANFSAKQREQFLLNAISLTKRLGDRNELYANRELALQQAVFNANKSNITEEIELNKLRQQADEVAASSLKKQKLLIAELQTVKNQAAQEDKAIIDQRNLDLVDNVESLTSLKDTEIDNINQLNDARDQYAKNNAERWQAEKDAADQAKKDYQLLAATVLNVSQVAGQEIGNLLAQGLLTFKEFGKILLKSTLDIVQKQINIYLAGLLAREVFGKGLAGLVSFALLSGLINGALQVAKAGIQNFNEGTESVPGQGNKDTVPAMLTPGERVVPAEINKQLAGIPNSELPNLLSNSQRDGLIASLLMSGNKVNNQMLDALLNLGYTYDRFGVRHIIKADGSKIEKFNI